MNGQTRSFRDPRDTTGRGGQPARLIRALQYARPLAPPLVVALPDPFEIVLGRGTQPTRRVLSRGLVALRVDTDDEWMSSEHARLARRAGRWFALDAGSKNGTFVNGARASEAPLSDGDLLELGSTMFVFRSAVANPGAGGEPVDAHEPSATDPPELATVHVPLAAALRALRRVAASDIPILIRGETGTGKELMARAAHTLSGRPGPFVPVNCGALPASLLESQLFGHRKGAFSGAIADAAGLVRAAHRGTLFLDEIAELSEKSQVALLRVLQEGEVLPVGATATVAVDVRFLAATHQDLTARMRSGLFREDLFGRLSGFELSLPPLRQRKEDLGLIVAGLLRDLAPERAPRIRLSRDTGRALFAHDWPRNIRELRAALALALTAAEDDELSSETLPPATVSDTDPVADAGSPEPTRAALVDALRTTAGNVSAAARQLGYSRAHFHRLLKRFAIDPADHRG